MIFVTFGADALDRRRQLAAYFDGTDLNNNVEGGNFMRRLRALSTVLGNPAVVIPAHPSCKITSL